MYELDEAQQQMVEGRLRTLRVLFLGILSGIVVFLVVVIFLRGRKETPGVAGQEDVLILTAIIFVSLTLLGTIFFRIIQIRLMAAVEGFSQVLQLYFSYSLIGMALCDGAAFLCLVWLLIGVNQVLMLVLFGLTFVGFLMQFPTRNRMVGAIERAEEMRALRQAYRIDD